MKNRNATIAVSLVLFTALALSACGRRGDPIRPSLARAQAAQEAGEKAPEAPQVEERRFILDPLLD